ncbi:AAEL006579-PA, partial [Aedes aegypti]
SIKKNLCSFGDAETLAAAKLNLQIGKDWKSIRWCGWGSDCRLETYRCEQERRKCSSEEAIEARSKRLNSCVSFFCSKPFFEVF